MSSTYEYHEIVGVSTTSVEDAIKQAIAHEGGKHIIAWFEVMSIRGRLVNNTDVEYQVTVKFGCKESK